MPFIETPLAAELTMIYREVTSGKEFTNGYSFLRETEWDLTTLGALAQAGIDSWDELMKAVTSVDVTLIGTKARSLVTESAPIAERAPTSPIAGTRGAIAMALHTCMTVTFRTARVGRSFRGRAYHTGLTRADLADTNSWQSTPALAVQNAFGVWLPAIAGEVEAEHCVISKQQGNVVLAEGEPNIVIGYVGRLPVATLRKRL